MATTTMKKAVQEIQAPKSTKSTKTEKPTQTEKPAKAPSTSGITVEPKMIELPDVGSFMKDFFRATYKGESKLFPTRKLAKAWKQEQRKNDPTKAAKLPPEFKLVASFIRKAVNLSAQSKGFTTLGEKSNVDFNKFLEHASLLLSDYAKRQDTNAAILTKTA